MRRCRPASATSNAAASPGRGGRCWRATNRAGGHCGHWSISGDTTASNHSNSVGVNQGRGDVRPSSDTQLPHECVKCTSSPFVHRQTARGRSPAWSDSATSLSRRVNRLRPDAAAWPAAAWPERRSRPARIVPLSGKLRMPAGSVTWQSGAVPRGTWTGRSRRASRTVRQGGGQPVRDRYDRGGATSWLVRPAPAPEFPSPGVRGPPPQRVAPSAATAVQSGQGRLSSRPTAAAGSRSGGAPPSAGRRTPALSPVAATDP